MPRLKDRNRQVPNGYSFYLPEVKWEAPKNFPSFTVVANGLEQVINANPYLAQKNGWPRDRKGIEDWVDTYNATLCAHMGYTDFLAGGEGGAAVVPKSQPPHQNLASLASVAARAKELVAGAKTLIEWLDDGEKPVDRDLAQSRASTCMECPKNEKGGWTRWFTVPASELIKRQVEKAQSLSMSTVHDESLHMCTACMCPLKLKVHVGVDWILKRLSPHQREGLKEGKDCWILREEAAKRGEVGFPP